MKKSSVLVLCAATLIFFVCSKDDNENPNGSGNFFFTSVKQVAPAITAGSKSMQRALTPGSIMNAIYTLLRDYENPRDEGVIDMSNIYKVIYESGQIYANAQGNCAAITEKIVPSPYPLGLSTEAYNCAGLNGTMTDSYANGYAIKDGAPKKGLLTYRWAPEAATGHVEHGILQGSYNESTGDLDLRMIHLVNYSSGGFVVRTHIAGNDQTHAFEIKTISSSTDKNTWTSIVGKGISRGTGYFLLRARSQANPATDKYFCIPASPTEAILDALIADPDGLPACDATDSCNTNCSAYMTDVAAMPLLTVSDVPASIADFTDSNPTGTIFLNY